MGAVSFSNSCFELAEGAAKGACGLDSEWRAVAERRKEVMRSTAVEEVVGVDLKDVMRAYIECHDLRNEY